LIKDNDKLDANVQIYMNLK